MSLAPLLPREFEQEIFLLAAYCDPLSVPTLMLVAWRVKQWVQNLLYRVTMVYDGVYIHSPGIGSAASKRSYPYPQNDHFSRIKAIPPPILRNSVRHLYLEHIPGDLAANLLSTCDAVHDLWMCLGEDPPSPIVELAGHLPLRRLHCSVTELFGMGNPIDDFSLPIFSQLTHLELFLGDGRLPEWAGIARIPHLTHLALRGETFIPLLPAVTVLDTSKTLCVLVLLPDFLEDEYEVELLRQDTRFV
ncbi:hypothetical protein FB45DRAFT_230462 [Roridomyces roridus]|uniref:Uncharacterized protein n=1 Tax=Roridomyces roridus TaxID=1738132 RepID=A0AAD7BBQ5_9AGAR|nr:hypothetical protein FB45DRAFT_230462 [Roridomyces roridus]